MNANNYSFLRMKVNTSVTHYLYFESQLTIHYFKHKLNELLY